MPSTFLGLNTAYLGLSAANAALNTTANNVSNVETEGYSRQYTVQQASDAMRAFTTYGCVGAGVEVLAVERYRDEFYDAKYWNNNANVGQYSVKDYYMKMIENYFRDDGEEGPLIGFNTIFNDMYAALEEVMKKSGTLESRQEFVGTAQSLTEYFNTMASNLQKMQKDVNDEIKVKTDAINSIAQEIATLNKQINVIELSGSTANELRDQRALLIDQLSEIVDVETAEMDVVDPNNPDRLTGATRYIVKIAGGQTLVDDTNYNTLECVARKSYEKVNQSDVDGLYDIKWSNGNAFSLTNASMGGELRGLIEMRDGNNGERFNGTVTGTDRIRIGGKEHSTVTVGVTADYLKDLSKCTLPDGGGQIMLGNKVYYFDSWSLDYNASSDSYSYTFVLSDSTKNDSTSVAGLLRKEAVVGSAINYQGIPYYMEQMNEWVREFARAFNDIMTQNGAIDNNGDAAQFFFRANQATDTTQWAFADSYVKDADGNYSITVSNNPGYPSSDSYYWLTASNFAVSNDIVEDPNKMATHTGEKTEVDKYDVVEDLLTLKNSTDRMSFRGCSSEAFLRCILSDISLNAQRASTFSENYQNVASAIANQRLSISGVDKDEEAINLVKFENAYTLASKMIQTLTEVYDRLILQTGV